MISPNNTEKATGRNVRLGGLLFLLIIGLSCTTFGQNLIDTGLDPATAQEIKYANILQSWGMADYAEMILVRIKNPLAIVKVKVMRLQSKIMMGKWDEVKAEISALPDQGGQEAWAMKLALADGYYTWGKYAQAQAIYDEFLGKYPGGPPPAIKEFFMNSAYKYAQMLILMGDKPGAIKTYDKLVKAKPPRTVARQVQAEMAELMITLMEDEEKGATYRGKYRGRLDKIISSLFWVQDLWFSKAVVLRAHVQIMDGELDKAMQLIDDYRPQLMAMDKILKEEEEKTGQAMSKLSPMAECRYLIATVLEKEAEKLMTAGGQDARVIELLTGKEFTRGIGRNKKILRTDGALQHYYNVFLQYPNTPWAPDAGSKAKKLKELLEIEYDAEIGIEVGPEQLAKVEKAQFREARSLFNQNQYEQAIVAYKKVLNLFPESETGVAALGELARCYVEVQDDLMFDVTAHYLAERFGRNRQFFVKAGDITLQLGAYMAQLNLPEKKDELMDLYFRKCPRHPSVPVMIMKRGDEKLLKEDYEGAADDYQVVENSYSNSIVYENALSKRSICLFELDKKVEGITTLSKYIKLLEAKEVPDNKLLSAKFRLAQMYRKLGKKYIGTGFKYYKEIVDLMEDEKHRFHKSLNEDEKNHGFYEAAIFYQGICYIMRAPPGDKGKPHRLKSITFFEKLVTKSPKSTFAPQCLLQMATLYTVLGDAEKTATYLKRLKKDYPESKEADNADYLYAKALMEQGRVKEAMKVYEGMFKGGGNYSDKQILASGMDLLVQKQYEIALLAYERLKNTKEERMIQRVMLGLGECYYGTGEVQKAIDVLEEMLKKFPNTGHTPTAATILSKAYGDTAMEEPDPKKRKLLFNKAVIHEKTVRKYKTEEADKKASALRVSGILRKKALAAEKFGEVEAAREYAGKAAASYQTIIMFTDAKNTALANVIQDAYKECGPLLKNLEMWPELLELCEDYLEEFPAPKGKYTSEMRSLRNKAKVRMATMDAPTDVEEDLAEDVAPIEDVDRGDEPAEAKPADGAPAAEVTPATPAAGPAAKPAAPPVVPAQPAVAAPTE